MEFEEEVKVPEFAELTTMEGWVHKNQAVLSVIICLFSWGDARTMWILRFLRKKFKQKCLSWLKKIHKSKDFDPSLKIRLDNNLELDKRALGYLK